MIIASRDGRHRSEWTRAEKWADLLKRLDNMTDKERKLFLRTLEDFEVISKAGNVGFDSRDEVVQMSSFYSELTATHYEGELVGLDEFRTPRFESGIEVNRFMIHRRCGIEIRIRPLGNYPDQCIHCRFFCGIGQVIDYHVSR